MGVQDTAPRAAAAEPIWVNAEQAAGIAPIYTPRYLKRLRDERRVRTYKRARRILYRRQDLIQWIEESETPPADGR
jgi:hypothetical protein